MSATAGGEGRHGLQRVEQIMGMPIIIDVRDPEVAPETIEQAFAWLRLADATFSTYKADSEISRLNRGELALADAHPDVRAVLERCAQLREETGGYFDIRAAFLAGGEHTASSAWSPDAVDPSGLVKGWSVDRAARILDAGGARNYCINAGGDIRVRGRPALTSRWRIGIQHPLLRDRLAAVVEAGNLAIATSGAYERGAHIVNPHTGHAPSDVLSVTIVGPDLATADAYATAAYAMGRAGPPWTARLAGYEAMTILSDETVLSTMAFP
ncbi:MAG TPA: FAD:protein FMN transferase, partial [Chloroflexota bacterium]|nr:FAD:protein FMN transferase [Chloroflexota bacterium]